MMAAEGQDATVGPGRAKARIGGLMLAVLGFSVFVNLLMLTGPLFMLQVYDRVLASGSRETLAALFLLVVFLYAILGVLDVVRGRLGSRAAARIQAALEGGVFAAGLAPRARPRSGADAPGGLHDLDAVQRFLASPALMAVFDLPWTPIFLAAIFLFHPLLGTLALAGGVLLLLTALVTQLATARLFTEAQNARHDAERMAAGLGAGASEIDGLTVRDAVVARWQAARAAARRLGIAAADRAGGFTALSRTLRLLLQSAMLALGALLVLEARLSPGAMIAASILMGRALAPVEHLIAHWGVLQEARRGWRRLRRAPASGPPAAAKLCLPRPAARLDVRGLTVIPPGGRRATVRNVSFTLAPGEALGVIGPSGAGKSTLARALAGLWAPAAGAIRLDGASLDQYAPAALGRYLGCLPQNPTLFDGTVAENIARMAVTPDDEAVIAAARAADAHEMILALPRGYETPLSGDGGPLSGGQVQRLGLARAVYGRPPLLILDEPNANLDTEGSAALNRAVAAHKAAGGAVVIVAHRPAAIWECGTLMVLADGRCRALGPRDEVLRRTVRNAEVAHQPAPLPERGIA